MVGTCSGKDSATVDGGGVGTKTDRSRVGDPNYGSRNQWVTGNVETAIYPGSGPLDEVIPYVLLDCIDVIV